MSQLEANKQALPEVIFRRCRHIVSENARVLDSAKALEQGDLAALGEDMAASHKSLRDDFEVSCEELDLMVDIAQRQAGVIGARMTGGGFGGCTINLVETDQNDAFRANVVEQYQRATGITPEIYVSSAGEGAREISLS
jgi:galactokinase